MTSVAFRLGMSLCKQAVMGAGPEWQRYAAAHPFAASMGLGGGQSASPGTPPQLGATGPDRSMSGFGQQFGNFLGTMSGNSPKPGAAPAAPAAPPPSLLGRAGSVAADVGQFAASALNPLTPFMPSSYSSMVNSASLTGLLGTSGLFPGLSTANWAAKKMAPQWHAQAAQKLAPYTARAGSLLPKGPGALSNAWNMVQPAMSKIPGVGRFLPGASAAPANVFAGATGTAGAGGAAGTAATGAGALYGAYALGDLAYSGHQLATGQANLRERAADQLSSTPGAMGYLENVGGNLARPGMATFDMLSSAGDLANLPGEYMRGNSLDSRLAASRQRYQEHAQPLRRP